MGKRDSSKSPRLEKTDRSKRKLAQDAADKDINMADQYSMQKDDGIKDKKKRKTASSERDEDDVATKKKRRHSKARDSSDDEDKNPPVEPVKKNKKSKKRVSFGTGTKVNDGSQSSDSSDEADNEADADDSSDTVTHTEESEARSDSEKALEEMRKRKREKKKERKNKPANPTPATHIHETPILSYLSHYYRDRASWKFQKNRETHLFKHLYSTEHVPALYNAPLLTYLQGLKGDAAKSRLRDAAIEVAKTDVETDEKKEQTDTEYQEAIEAFRAALPAGSEQLNSAGSAEGLRPEKQIRLQKRLRAELIYFAVTAELFSMEAAVPKTVAPKPEPVNKKRKNRTAVIDISSSSEDETSSSGSSDDDTSSSDSSDSDSDDAPAVISSGKEETGENGASSSESSSSNSSSEDDSPGPAATPKKELSKKEKMKEKKKEEKKLKKQNAQSAPPAAAKNKKTQKRKLRTAQIEISSSESDSD